MQCDPLGAVRARVRAPGDLRRRRSRVWARCWVMMWHGSCCVRLGGCPGDPLEAASGTQAVGHLASRRCGGVHGNRGGVLPCKLPGGFQVRWGGLHTVGHTTCCCCASHTAAQGHQPSKWMPSCRVMRQPQTGRPRSNHVLLPAVRWTVSLPKILNLADLQPGNQRQSATPRW